MRGQVKAFEKAAERKQCHWGGACAGKCKPPEKKVIGVLNVSIIDNGKSYKDVANTKAPDKPKNARKEQHNPECQGEMSVPFNKAKSPPIKVLLENALKKKGWTEKDLIHLENPNGQLPMNSNVTYKSAFTTNYVNYRAKPSIEAFHTFVCRFVRCRVGKDGNESTEDLVLAFFKWLINAARMKLDDARRIIDNEVISITRKLQWDRERREYRRPTYKKPILIEIKNLRSVFIFGKIKFRLWRNEDFLHNNWPEYAIN